MLPYDQIPRERLATGDATGRLGERNGVLGVALAQWMARDDSKPGPAARRAANTAMDTIDAMVRELHALRARLADEIRDSDDTTATRADALLAQRQAPRADPRAPAQQMTRQAAAGITEASQ